MCVCIKKFLAMCVCMSLWLQVGSWISFTAMTQCVPGVCVCVQYLIMNDTDAGVCYHLIMIPLHSRCVHTHGFSTDDDLGSRKTSNLCEGV